MQVCGQDAHGGNQQNGCGQRFNWQTAPKYQANAMGGPDIEEFVEVLWEEVPVCVRAGAYIYDWLGCPFIVILHMYTILLSLPCFSSFASLYPSPSRTYLAGGPAPSWRGLNDCRGCETALWSVCYAYHWHRLSVHQLCRSIHRVYELRNKNHKWRSWWPPCLQANEVHFWACWYVMRKERGR